MRLLFLPTKILSILLITRMIAAPIALRPDSSTPCANYHLVMRVCAWPAQRPQRSPTSSEILIRSRIVASGVPDGDSARARPNNGLDGGAIPPLRAGRSNHVHADSAAITSLRC